MIMRNKASVDANSARPRLQHRYKLPLAECFVAPWHACGQMRKRVCDCRIMGQWAAAVSPYRPAVSDVRPRSHCKCVCDFQCVLDCQCVCVP
jgi:hypothetical protein